MTLAPLWKHCSKPSPKRVAKMGAAGSSVESWVFDERREYEGTLTLLQGHSVLKYQVTKKLLTVQKHS